MKTNIFNNMTLEQKAKLCVGMNFWMTQNYPDLDIPSLFMSDGPHGLRKQEVEKSDHLGMNDSHPSVCYPTGVLTACSWDEELLFMLGDHLGREAVQLGVDILLAPAINIKRSPLCGRNFEYYSEDPYLAGKLAAAFVRGVQKNKIAACPKHFVANNQETRRKAVNEIIDERTLREIYLLPFEMAIKEGNTWALMSSYNKINGTYVSEHLHITKKILREEWGFQGALITDWGAMDQIAPSITAGLSVQMPGDHGYASQKIIKAVEKGELSIEVLDKAVISLLNTIEKVQDKPEIDMSAQDYHDLAAMIATESMVLLKNEDEILPLSEKSKIGVIGEMAIKPRYQGSGSSHVNPYVLTTPLEEMKKTCSSIEFARGYENEKVTDDLLLEACAVAGTCEKLVVFTGLPDSYEAETYDRADMKMPPGHVRLIEELAKINPQLVVVLSCGSAVEMPWLSNVKGVLGAFLGGESGAIAVSDLLFGRANPCGKLAESFPEKLEDNPSFLYYPGEGDVSEYREGIFVGYRYYEKKGIKPVFPFGFGLSYTTFDYSNLQIEPKEIEDTAEILVKFNVKNTGKRAGKEIVQVYIRHFDKKVIKPVKELKGFKKVSLEAGEEKEVSIMLDRRSFAYFNTYINDWHVSEGEYEICVGASVEDIRLSDRIVIHSTKTIRMPVTRNTLLMDIFADDARYKKFQSVYESIKPFLPFNLNNMDLETDVMARSLLNNMTLNSLASYVGESLNDEKLDVIIGLLNQE